MADKGGLEGIVVARSRLCSIDGQKGVLIYGGYDVGDLAEHSSYEETCFLILRGRLPSRDELEAFTSDLSAASPLSDETAAVIDMLASHAAPMEMLRTAVSADSFDDPDKDSNAEEANFRKATRLIAKMPTMVARYDRRRRGLDPVEPDPGLGHAANFLYMLSGEPPDQQAARTFDVALILHADHEMNASTFTARVIASTLSDMHSAITGAIGALKGPLHGGANEQVMHLLMDIGSDENIEQEIRGRLDRKERIMGFGHRVYKTYDPRAVILKRYSQVAGRALGRAALVLDERAHREGRDGGEGPVPERGLLLRLHLPLPRHRDRAVHAHLRDEPGGGLGRARDRAARRQPPDPAQLGVRGTGASALPADRAAQGAGSGVTASSSARG